MLGKYKINTQTLPSLSILLLIGLAIIGYVLFSSSNNSSSSANTSELVIANSGSGLIYLTDKSGKQLSKATFPKFSRLNYQAVAPNGGILASMISNTNQESFIFTKSNTIKTYSDEAAKVLGSSASVQSSHQIFFVDERSTVVLTCLNPDTDCLLQRFNTSTGATTKILDTGVKQTNQYIPSVYLVGYAPVQHLAYVRVLNAKNKLGNLNSGIYGVNINNSKVVSSHDMSLLVGLTTSLSPDGNRIAYTAYDNKGNITVSVLNLSSNTTQKIQWSKGQLLTGQGALKWSPDSTKILTQTVNVVLPTGVTLGDRVSNPLVIAYIDLAKNNSIHVIQQIKNSTQQTIYSLGWLDNSQIAYQIKKSTKINGLAGTTNQTLKQNINGDPASSLQVPAGDLLQPVLY